MTTDEKEATAMRLLEEVARERYAGECVLIRVELLGDNGTLEVIDANVTRLSFSSTSVRSAQSAAP